MRFPRWDQNTESLLAFSFLAGTILNSLKLSSTLTLVSKVRPERFIFLLLITTLFLLLASRLLGRFEQRNKTSYLRLSLVFPSLTLALDYFFFQGRESFSIVATQYLLTVLGIALVEEALKLFQTKCLSPLASEKEKERVALSEEMGHIFSSLALLLSPFPSTALVMGLASTLIFILLLPTLMIRLSFFSGDHAEELPPSSTYASLGRNLLLFLIGLGIIKISYSLILYEGYQKLQSASLPAKQIYLYVSLAQGAIILMLIYARSRIQFLSHWVRKAFVYLWFQVIFLLVAALFTSPWMLIASGSLRKSLNHSLLNFGLFELFLQLPARMISAVRKVAEISSQAIGMGILGLLAYFYYRQNHSIEILALVIASECVLVSFALMFLKRQLVKFHLEAIRSTDPGQALASSYGLRICASGEATKPLIELLKSTRSTHLKRSIIQTLGSYPSAEVANAILTEFNRQDREDMKVSCIQSLQKIGDENIRKKLLEDLELIPLEQQSFEQFRWRLYLSISASEFHTARDRLLTLIEKEKVDSQSRALANALLILSEIAKISGANLASVFRSFLKPAYSRRIRTNAAVGLHQTNPGDPDLAELLKELKNSMDQSDRNAWVYFHGEVHDQTARREIENRSQGLNHQEPTVLLALLKLEHPQAPALLADYFHSLEQEQAISLIHALNSVKSQDSRLAFYNSLTGTYPEDIEKLLTCLTYSKRDFGDDYQKILLELRFRGIDTMRFAKVARFGHYR